MRKLFLIMVCISLLATGCWDYREVDRLAPVLALGIDRIPGDKSILLTVQIPKPEGKGEGKQTGGKGGEKPYTVMHSEGKSLSEAIRYLSMQSTRGIFISHCKTIVIGNDFAETGICEVLDELKRHREFRRSDWLLTTDKTAKEILEKDFAMAQLPARGLDQILQIFQETGRILSVSLNDFFVRINEDSCVSFTPLIQLEDIDKRVTSQLEKATGRSLEDSEEKSQKIIIGKTVVYKKIIKVGVLNEEESQAHRWLLGSAKGNILGFTYAPLDQTNGEKGEVSLDFIESKTTIKPQLSEDDITMHIEMTAKLALHETGLTGVKVLDLKELEQLKYQAAETIKLRFKQMIDKAQKDLKSDCVGFAENIHNYYPVKWKQIKPNWEEIFPTVNYQISCDVEILSSGMISDSMQQSDLKD